MNPRLLALTVLGLGRLPIAPGTFGSLPPVVLGFGLITFQNGVSIANLAVALLGLAAAICCIRFGREGEEQLGSKDPPSIVADEIAGQSIAILFLPWRDAAEWRFNLMLALGSFIAFRVFDIAKPPPIRGLQGMTGGWGILMDDVVAGLYALGLVQIVARTFILR